MGGYLSQLIDDDKEHKRIRNENRELTGHYIPGDPGIASDKASIGSTWEIFCQKTGNRFYSFSDSKLKCIDCFIVTSSSWAVARASRTKPVNWCYV